MARSDPGGECVLREVYDVTHVGEGRRRHLGVYFIFMITLLSVLSAL